MNRAGLSRELASRLNFFTRNRLIVPQIAPSNRPTHSPCLPSEPRDILPLVTDMSKPSDFVQGTLDLLLLKILALEPLHGWAVSQRLRQISSDVLQVSDGISTLPCTSWSKRAEDQSRLADNGK